MPVVKLGLPLRLAGVTLPCLLATLFHAGEYFLHLFGNLFCSLWRISHHGEVEVDGQPRPPTKHQKVWAVARNRRSCAIVGHDCRGQVIRLCVFPGLGHLPSTGLHWPRVHPPGPSPPPRSGGSWGVSCRTHWRRRISHRHTPVGAPEAQIICKVVWLPVLTVKAVKARACLAAS